MNPILTPAANASQTPGFKASVAICPRIPTGVVAATVAGNALEFYDFVTYAFFAVFIGITFFPASTPLNSLLLSLACLAWASLRDPWAVCSLVLSQTALAAAQQCCSQSP
jgi:hypothetical protein